jgi:p-aminobenzoyl-glutamate transporter AbgT
MRPLAVSLIAIYQILRGILGVLFALGILLFTSLAAKLASLASEGNFVERMLGGLGHMLGYAVLLFALAHLLAGFGLFKMGNWARLLTLFLCALGLVGAVAALGRPNPWVLVSGIINAVSLLYLALPPVKRAFHAQRTAMRAAA